MVYALQLKTLTEKVRPWCNTRLGFPAKAGQERSSQGDMVLFSALMTYAGSITARAYVPSCIAEDGRPVRSPDLVNEPSEEDAFSKDMLLGVLLWSLVTKKPEPLQRLLKYLQRTGCLCEKASDRRCTLTPQVIYLTNQVAKKLGIPERLEGDWMPGWLFGALEVASAFVTPLGYQCHLISVKSLIVRLLGKESQLAPTILARRDPGNPWFLWLAGKKDEATKLLLELDAEPGQGHQWCWERDSAEKAWKDSMGWDILFLCNLCSRE